MALTLSEATELREAYRLALLAIATGEEYEIGNRRLKRADLAEVRKTFEYYDDLVTAITAGRSGIRVQRAIPRDL